METEGGPKSNEGKFLPLLGKLVLNVADVEGAAGEVIVLTSDRTALSSGWAQSGQQLIRTLRKCHGEADFQRMCDDMLTLLPQRNLVMHGEWMFLEPKSDVAYVMNRRHEKSPEPTPNYDWANVSVYDLQDLIAVYERVFDGLRGYVSDALGSSA